MSEHIIEALGLSKVTIKDGKVVDVTEPEITYCPLFDHHKGIKKLTKEEIAKNMQFRIDDFGMCTPQRVLRMKDFLNFGISEIMSTLLEKNEIDSVVMVLEGCGTLIVNEPELVQGIGGKDQSVPVAMPEEGGAGVFGYLILQGIEILLLLRIFAVEDIGIHGDLEIGKVPSLGFVIDKHFGKGHLRMLLTEGDLLRSLPRLCFNIQMRGGSMKIQNRVAEDHAIWFDAGEVL